MQRYDYTVTHHGVKGMKWGVRRDLGPTGHIIGSKYAKDVSGPKTKKNQNGETYNSAALLGIAIVSAPAVIQAGVYLARSPHSGRYKRQLAGKMALDIGLSLTGMSSLIYAREASTALYKRAKSHGENMEGEKFTPKKKSNTDSTIEEDSKKVNPNLNIWKPGTGNNCANATLAYEMRRRGYDVKAKPLYGGRIAADILKSYNFPKTSSMVKNKENRKNFTKKAYETMMSDLNKMPDNARGAIMFSRDNGAGHIFNWEKTNGRVRLVDNQDYGSKPDKFFNTEKMSSLTYFRTDNATINMNAVGTSVENYEDKVRK